MRKSVSFYWRLKKKIRNFEAILSTKSKSAEMNLTARNADLIRKRKT